MVLMLIKWVLYLVPAIILRTLAYPIAPIAVLTLNEEGRPARIFRWLETHDNIGWSGPLSVEATRLKTEKYGRRVGMLFWWWRNRAYAAQYYLFSIRWLTESVEHKVLYNYNRNIPKWGPSFGVALIEADGKKYFELQPRLSLGYFRLYFRIGWKVISVENNKSMVGSEGMYTGFTPRVGSL